MALIKGIDILLYSGRAAEIVSNVLVGEPSAAVLPFDSGGIPAYTLGIPKGDAHTWTDAVVEFFGLRFRTVGIPEQGIEENVPTEWHKKVKVEQLVTMGSCTVYEKGTFRKHEFWDVLFYDLRSTAPSRAGADKQGDLQICIYSVSPGDGYAPKVGDYVIPYESDFEFDASTEKAVSESLAAFRKLHPDYATVHHAERRLCGVKHDTQLLCR